MESVDLFVCQRLTQKRNIYGQFNCHSRTRWQKGRAVTHTIAVHLNERHSLPLYFWAFLPCRKLMLLLRYIQWREGVDKTRLSRLASPAQVTRDSSPNFSCFPSLYLLVSKVDKCAVPKTCIYWGYSRERKSQLHTTLRRAFDLTSSEWCWKSVYPDGHHWETKARKKKVRAVSSSLVKNGVWTARKSWVYHQQSVAGPSARIALPLFYKQSGTSMEIREKPPMIRSGSLYITLPSSFFFFFLLFCERERGEKESYIMFDVRSDAVFGQKRFWSPS